ncbi:MAG: cobalamin biosynthesis protein CbiD [Clostridia bacterium]|nr:cobalamin biosynthesis protein CbiD [Clostridia bacterium]
MREYINKDGKRLRLGYTTGTCAAAASKAAAWMLLTGRRLEKITISTPKGINVTLDIEEISIDKNSVKCAVKKDSGDDPDITDGIYIFAEVSRISAPEILIEGGRGIGRVTKRGLDRNVGEAAINSGPRRQIRDNLLEVCRITDHRGGLSVLISAPEGESIAKKTLNSRLGIVGGISILGTTGIVEPMSEQALIETIRLELSERKESGEEYVMLAPGNYGIEYIKSLGADEKYAVVTSNFIGDALDLAVMFGFKGILIIGHMGKLVKLAGGMFNTHSKYGDCRMEIIAANAGTQGIFPNQMERILECPTCDAALDILKENNVYDNTLRRIMQRIESNISARISGKAEAGVIMFSRQHGFLCESENAQSLFKKIVKE